MADDGIGTQAADAPESRLKESYAAIWVAEFAFLALADVSELWELIGALIVIAARLYFALCVYRFAKKLQIPRAFALLATLLAPVFVLSFLVFMWLLVVSGRSKPKVDEVVSTVD